MRIFGIDPGSERTGYGCVETDGSRHHLVSCGAITCRGIDAFPERLALIHRELTAFLTKCRPDCVAIENLFHANNVRSALKLGHARGVAMLAAVEAGCPIVEYTPAEIKRAIVGYGRAEKHQVAQMVTLLLGLHKPPAPFDATDALAVAICHLHSRPRQLGRLLSGRLPASARSVAHVEAGLEAGPGRPKRSAPTATRATSGTQRAPTTIKSWRQYRPRP